VVARYFRTSFEVLRPFFKGSVEYLVRTFEVFSDAMNNCLWGQVQVLRSVSVQVRVGSGSGGYYNAFPGREVG
jgi:hypothetical protein